jgi:hypothetical protein
MQSDVISQIVFATIFIIAFYSFANCKSPADIGLR